MESKSATLVVQTDSGTYTLPASVINIDAVSQQLGTSVSLSDIAVTVIIAEPSASMIGGATELVKCSDAKVAANAEDIPYILQKKIMQGAYHSKPFAN